MSKGIYVGVETEVPIYETTTTTSTVALSNSNISDFFTVTQDATYGWTTSDQSGGGVKLVPKNIGVNSSTAEITLTAKQAISGITIKGIYYTESNYDKITITAAGTTVLNAVSGTNTSTSNRWSGSLSAGQTLYFKYAKDGSQHASSESSTYFAITGTSTITTTTTVQTGTELKQLAKKIKSIYVGNSSVAKKVKVAYVGVNGIAQVLFSSTKFAFTGDYTEQEVTVDNTAYHLYTLTSAGSLTLGEDADAWLCGGGQQGYTGAASHTSSTPYARGGAGGSGGYVNQINLLKGDYTIVIGTGGIGSSGGAKGGDTIVLDSSNNEYASALGGGNSVSNAYGGSGGGAGGYKSASSSTYSGNTNGAGISTLPFGITSLQYHCAGGGGGKGSYRAADSTSYSTRYGGNGGSNGGNGKTNADGIGGEYGGGHGAGTSYDGNYPTSATFYGGGSGGSRAYVNLSGNTSGSPANTSSGYQGVCYILMPV